MEGVGIYGIYMLIAAAIPLIIKLVRKLNFIPNDWLPVVVGVLSVIGVTLAQVATGVPVMLALTHAFSSPDTLTVGGTAAWIRQLVVKGPIKKKK